MSAVIMKAIQVLQFRHPPKLVTLPIPQPSPSQVLIKVQYSPVNPADLATMLGKYQGKSVAPCVLGVEGSGEVVAEGREVKGMVGKRVSFFTKGGAWAEYALAEKTATMEVAMGEMKQAACFCVNPLTALLLLTSFQGFPFLINAGASALARTLLQQAAIDRIPTVAIVRRPEVKTELQTCGGQVLVQGSEQYLTALQALKKEGKVRYAVDLVGGKATADLFNALGPGGVVNIVGNMSLRPISGIDDRAMRYENKQLVGFYLYQAWSALSPSLQTQYIHSLLTKYRSSLSVPVTGQHSLEAFETAIAASKTHAGKQVLTLF